MPALITHRLFGEESIELLPEGIIKDSYQRSAFMLGNQGPDPYFFNYITTNGTTSRKLASAMHATYITASFQALYDG